MIDKESRYIKWLMRKENEVDIEELTKQFRMFEKSSGLLNTLVKNNSINIFKISY